MRAIGSLKMEQAGYEIGGFCGREEMISSALLKYPGGYINGRWCPAASGATQSVFNPATGDVLASVPVMGGRETRLAVAAAGAAQHTPSTIAQRRVWLNQLADLIVHHREELGRIITHEHGKPWKEAQAEADYAASFFRYYAGCVEQLCSRSLAERPRNHAWTINYRPAGVAALITPWNFPLAMLAKKFSAALAADCSCVIKPSSKTPLSMMALFSLLEQIDFPAGRANLVTGPAAEISEMLCQHPDVRVISFTGSTSVGKHLAATAAPYLKRLALELGGNAPFIIFSDADTDRAIDHLIANKFRGTGQTCVCANRIYVQRTLADSFARRLAERVQDMKSGNGMDPDVDLGPLIDRKAFDKVARHVQDALAQGAKCLTGGVPPRPTSDFGCFYPPTVLCDVTSSMACVSEETFGPIVPIVAFDSEAEVIAAANATEYGLAAYVFTEDAERAQRVISGLNFGHVGYNTGTGPTAEAPFGGMKLSGFGREGGLEGLHDFVETQTVPRPV